MLPLGLSSYFHESWKVKDPTCCECSQILRLLVSFGGIHSGKINMEPKNHLFEKEKSSSKPSFLGSFSGVYVRYFLGNYFTY